MGFRGYYQRICINGHFERAHYMAHEQDPPCSSFGALPAWDNLVDDTNHQSVGFVKVAGPREVVNGERLYDVPSLDQARLRWDEHIWDEESQEMGAWVPI